MARPAFLAIIALAVFLISACNPCRELEQKRCACIEDVGDRKSCEENIDVRGRHPDYAKAVNEERCVEVLSDPKCDCLQLNLGNAGACGLTRSGDAK